MIKWRKILYNEDLEFVDNIIYTPSRIWWMQYLV